MFPETKVGVTERPRLLNPDKAIVMVICPIIVHFIFYDSSTNSRALIS